MISLRIYKRASAILFTGINWDKMKTKKKLNLWIYTRDKEKIYWVL
jgi:hypothetical protein